VFFRRSKVGDDPWLTQKMWIFTAGAGVALLGMLMDASWLIAIGALLLAAGIALRFVPRRTDQSPEAAQSPEGPEGPEDPDDVKGLDR
jgi:hypothetical protein